MATIFIGHARQNSAAAVEIGAALRNQGYTAQTGGEIASGSNWREATESAIRAADAYIYLHSPDATASPWLQNELLFAINQKKPIVPVILAPASFPQPLLNYQFIDATAGVSAVLQKITLAVDAVTSLPLTKATGTFERARTAAAPFAPPPAPPAPLYAPKRGGAPVWLIAAGALGILLIGIVVVIALSTTNSLMQNTTPHATPPPSTSEPLPQPSSPLILPGLTATFGEVVAIDSSEEEEAVQVAVAATVAAVRATEERSLSAAELALVAPLTQMDSTPLLLTGLVSALSLGTAGAALVIVLRTNQRHTLPRRAHAPHHSGQPDQAQALLPAPLLADFQVFTSSSEKDRQWVERLIEDLETMGYLVWWYAKDAPGLPFGNEIRSAIYHTKVFLIVLSPDSMQSKHVEEEIRWAEIYDRPIVPVLYRPISLDERLYGLAKGADIDFANDAYYREALELLTQAIDHHLQKRLEALPT